MRVVHVITRLIIGGAQENTIASVLGLQRKAGMEVRLVSGPTYGAEGSLEGLVSQPPGLLTIVPQLVRPVHPWKDWLAWRRLTALFRSWRPEVVHTHSGKAGVLGRLAAASAGVPLIIHTIHGPSFGPFQGSLANALFGGAERYAARVTHHFVVVADAMREQYLAAGIGRPEQYTKILSGFDLSPFLAVGEARGPLTPGSAGVSPASLRIQHGFAPDDIIVGKIARLFKLKGHEDLVAMAPAVVRRCPRVKFLLVGDGPLRERIERQVDATGLRKHFVFAGLVDPAAIPQWIGMMDILVHLSAREGLPRALPQALAAGKPVVAYDADGAREVCIEGQTGFLVRPGDTAVLEDRLVKLAQDPALRQRLGDCGREFVLKRFGVQRMVEELQALYARLARAGDQ